MFSGQFLRCVFGLHMATYLNLHPKLPHIRRWKCLNPCFTVLNGIVKYSAPFSVDCMVATKPRSYDGSCTLENTMFQQRNRTIKIPVIYRKYYKTGQFLWNLYPSDSISHFAFSVFSRWRILCRGNDWEQNLAENKGQRDGHSGLHFIRETGHVQTQVHWKQMGRRNLHVCQGNLEHSILASSGMQIYKNLEDWLNVERFNLTLIFFVSL